MRPERAKELLDQIRMNTLILLHEIPDEATRETTENQMYDALVSLENGLKRHGPLKKS